jgi:hypothetical protein
MMYRSIVMLRKIVVFFTFLAASLSLLGAQELKINYQYKVNGPDAGNFLTFTGPLRYIAVEKDTLDAATGASAKKSTAFFTPYQTDVLGKAAFPSALRNVLLYPVAPQSIRTDNNLQVSKAANGVITIQFVHRGVAYGIITDNTGKVNLGPAGAVKGTQIYQRTLGYIQGAGPQVLHTDFSPDGSAAKVNYGAVWNPSTPSGKTVGNTQAKTGARIPDGPDPASLFYWTGSLQANLDNSILKISGTLKAERR